MELRSLSRPREETHSGYNAGEHECLRETAAKLGTNGMRMRVWKWLKWLTMSPVGLYCTCVTGTGTGSWPAKRMHLCAR